MCFRQFNVPSDPEIYALVLPCKAMANSFGVDLLSSKLVHMCSWSLERWILVLTEFLPVIQVLLIVKFLPDALCGSHTHSHRLSALLTRGLHLAHDLSSAGRSLQFLESHGKILKEHLAESSAEAAPAALPPQLPALRLLENVHVSEDGSAIWGTVKNVSG